MRTGAYAPTTAVPHHVARRCLSSTLPVVCAPTVLLDMDGTVAAALPHNSNSSRNDHPHDAVSEEGFVVLRKSRWMYSARWFEKVQPVLAPPSSIDGEPAQLFDVDVPRWSLHHSPRTLCSSTDDDAWGGRLVDIVLRPNILTFLRRLDAARRIPYGAGVRSPPTATPSPKSVRWRICTANHPANALSLLFRLRNLLSPDDGGVGEGERSSAAWSTETRRWALQHLAFATYGKQDGADAQPVRMVPRKALRSLLIPVVDDRPLTPPVVGSQEDLQRLTLRSVSFPCALLFDDTCNVLDPADVFCLKRSFPVRRFGAAMQSIDAIQPLGTDAHPLSRLQVTGASADDVTDALFLCRSLDEENGNAIDDSVHDSDGLAMRLVESTLQVRPPPPGEAVHVAAPSSCAEDHDRLWSEACAPFMDELAALHE